MSHIGRRQNKTWKKLLPCYHHSIQKEVYKTEILSFSFQFYLAILGQIGYNKFADKILSFHLFPDD